MLPGLRSAGGAFVLPSRRAVHAACAGREGRRRCPSAWGQTRNRCTAQMTCRSFAMTGKHSFSACRQWCESPPRSCRPESPSGDAHRCRKVSVCEHYDLASCLQKSGPNREALATISGVFQQTQLGANFHVTLNDRRSIILGTIINHQNFGAPSPFVDTR